MKETVTIIIQVITILSFVILAIYIFVADIDTDKQIRKFIFNSKVLSIICVVLITVLLLWTVLTF
jgi:hypothetical protein